MINFGPRQDVLHTPSSHDYAQQTLTASRRASAKLNDAIGAPRTHSTLQSQSHNFHHNAQTHSQYSVIGGRDTKEIGINPKSFTSDEAPDALQVSHLTLQASPVDKRLDVRPPPRPVLPSLQIINPPSNHARERHDSISSSPALAKFTITPADGHPSQTLPRLQNHTSPPSASGYSPDIRQTLPSLEIALSSVVEYKGLPCIDDTPNLPRVASNQQLQYGLSPSIYSYHTPTATMSPPRLSSNPSAWRTLSQNSSNSATSDSASGHVSNSASTPATRASPPHSTSTSQYPASEHDSVSDADLSTIGNGMGEFVDSNGQSSINASQGYSCTFPGCTAAPFQTQYLLNSHTNVHSNQRPHFCPVDGCPRGPGGQGFKRKNEMIRHGLVHQSPGYVCPFCLDQQHKYPRPDNLQRHVRVHHVDKDRDDPLLREVLAQRPEGGNRGRRRRLGG